MHKTKAKGSNIGYAFKMMINSVDYVLGGTGTLFGGKSTDLFFLLHRINHEVRKRFGFNQESAWSATYGRQQMIFADEGDEESFTTGKRRRIARVKELPGISPAIYRWVFEQVVFLKVCRAWLPDAALCGGNRAPGHGGGAEGAVRMALQHAL